MNRLDIHSCLKMPKKFEVSEKRCVLVKKEEVCFIDDRADKMATFTFPRSSWFTEQFDEIENSISKVVKGEADVKLRLRIGGGRYVSVTSGVRCIDVRKFFLAQDGTVKPTRKGFAIRLNEWDRVKKIAGDIKEQHPKIAEAQPCWTQVDHFNQEGAIMCS